MIKFEGNERVLVCPLGWGLGHATRVIPIITALKNKRCTIIVAADESSISLLKRNFPSLDYIHFPSISVEFSKGRNQLFALFRVAFKIILLSGKENRQIREIVKDQAIDIIISDNRYGLHHEQKKSILITHQLSILFPKPFRWAENLGKWFVKRSALKFSECWIPDNELGFRLSGQLSDPWRFGQNIKFIGLLSRFSQTEYLLTKKRWDLVGIVSGPPPHRQIFEDQIVELSNRLKLRTLVLQGTPNGKGHARVKGKATLVPHLEDHQFAQEVMSSKYIICRAGYSTIMDMVSLGVNAMLVPTPGQTEQEYLSEYLSDNELFMSCSQDRVSKLEVDDFKIIPNRTTKAYDLRFFSTFEELNQ
jgi:predicted glycosyltransferase